MALQSISNVLLKPTDKLVIKLSVSLLTNDGKGYYNIFENKNKSYMVTDISSNIRLEYKEKDSAWNRDKMIYINSKNIYQFIRGLNEVKEMFDNKVLYRQNQQNELELLPLDPEDSVIIDNLGFGQVVKFVPAVIYDKNDKDFMGLYMFMNESTYAVDLTIDEFESIWYLFNNVNIRLETQTLLNLQLLEQLKAGVGNSAIVTNDTIIDTKKELRKHLESVGAKNIFDLVNREMPVEKESVSGGTIKKDPPKSLDDL